MKIFKEIIYENTVHCATEHSYKEDVKIITAIEKTIIYDRYFLWFKLRDKVNYRILQNSPWSTYYYANISLIDSNVTNRAQYEYNKAKLWLTKHEHV